MGNPLETAAEHAQGVANTVHFLIPQFELDFDQNAAIRGFIEPHEKVISEETANTLRHLNSLRASARAELAAAERALKRLARAYGVASEQVR